MLPFESAIERAPKWLLGVAAFLFVVLLQWAESAATRQVSFFVIQIPVIFAAAWIINARTAIALSLFAAVVWLLDQGVIDQGRVPTLFQSADAAIRFGVLAFYSMVLGRLKTALEAERRASRTDGLTGLLNRKAFFEMAAATLDRCRRRAEPATLAFFDCDNFKYVNDHQGHDAGDQLLQCVARSLATGCRSQDYVARFGGDEFVALLPAVGGAGARSAIERLQRVLAKEIALRDWPVTFSIGVVTFLRMPASVDEMIREADQLMYVVKRGAKDAAEYKVVDAEANGELSPRPLPNAVGGRSGR